MEEEEEVYSLYFAPQIVRYARQEPGKDPHCRGLGGIARCALPRALLRKAQEVFDDC